MIYRAILILAATAVIASCLGGYAVLTNKTSIDPGDGRANEYLPSAQPSAGEVELPQRDTAVAGSGDPEHSISTLYYT
ncbi:MAG: hypothetical protein J07HX5_01514 [halophilic archaeon J07HX5]|nr:MAG: hypothetical protein J07HX5_01514 [halophilic archaeon J07HX5]